MKKQFFISGSGTGVGKTCAAALLCRVLAAEGETLYLKLVQTGSGSDSDEAFVIGSCRGKAVNTETLLRYKHPASPHLAASLESKKIFGARLAGDIRQHLAENKRLICEAAGGIMVPLNLNYLNIDLMRDLGMKNILVTSSALGTLNHTLLSLKALKAAGVKTQFIIMSRLSGGRLSFIEKDNIATIRKLSGLPLIVMPFTRDFKRPSGTFLRELKDLLD